MLGRLHVIPPLFSKVETEFGTVQDSARDLAEHFGVWLKRGVEKNLLCVFHSLRPRRGSSPCSLRLQLTLSARASALLLGTPPSATSLFRLTRPSKTAMGLTIYVAGNAGLAMASRACDERALETHFTDLSPASRALLLSQAGPHSGRVFTVLPTSDDVTIASAQFRVLLLRRLRLPLALCPRTCRCGRSLDPLGDHRAACATSGVLPTRALPLEHALARVCREAGARVARAMFASLT